MAKVNIQQVAQYTLTLELSEDELIKLSCMVQNPMCGYSPETEPADIRSIRKAIFDACTEYRK